LARALAFLIENPYITGETLKIAGGWTFTSPTPRLDFVDSDTGAQDA
jgi:hypothetical protein